MYGMLHNASGHVLHRLAVACPAAPILSCPDFSVPRYGRPGDFKLDPSAEVIFGVSSFAPTQTQGADPTYHPFSVSTERNTTTGGGGPAVNKISLLTMTLGSSDPALLQQQRNTSIRSGGLTLVSVQQSFVTLPSITKLSRSSAEVSGGLLLTIYGGPFVNTKSNIQCRWRFLGSTGTLTSENVLSTNSFFRSTSAVVCETPVLAQARRTKLDLTISGGATWTLDVRDFTFFQITSASPVISSIKTFTAVEIKGRLLQDLAEDLVSGSYMLDGEQVVMRDIVRNSACEFGPTPVFQLGTNADDGSPYPWESQGLAPGLPPMGPERCSDLTKFCVQGGSSLLKNASEGQGAYMLFRNMTAGVDSSGNLATDSFGRIYGPRYLADSCTSTLVGLNEELICSLVCYAPPAPSVSCLNPDQQNTVPCKTYVQSCPSSSTDSSVCLMLVALLKPYDFRYII